MSIINDMSEVLDVIYDTDVGEAESAYYAGAGQSMFGTDDDAKAVLGESVPVIISYGEGDEDQGADAMDMIARIRVRATGDDGITTVEHRDEFYLEDPNDTGNYWQVMHARKSADGLEWICECSRLVRIGEDR